MSLVLGYHGCSTDAARELLGGAVFKPSDKSYDWLGAGSYFWEWDFQRAWEWANRHRASRPNVVGAAIELGHCLDLTQRSGIEAVEAAYQSYANLQKIRGNEIPENRNASSSGTNKDRILRHLDRAVIDHLHENYATAAQRNGGATREFDTVRSLFPEGEELYPGAGFWKQTHVQIAVRNPGGILGVFRLPQHQLTKLGIPKLYEGF